VHHSPGVCGDQRVRDRNRQVEHLEERQPSGGNQRCEILTFDQLHGDEARARGFLDRVQDHDIRVIEARHRSRLALEAHEAVG
jgi:hypothetical protein